jgi:hypothetical protein
MKPKPPPPYLCYQCHPWNFHACTVLVLLFALILFWTVLVPETLSVKINESTLLSFYYTNRTMLFWMYLTREIPLGDFFERFITVVSHPFQMFLMIPQKLKEVSKRLLYDIQHCMTQLYFQKIGQFLKGNMIFVEKWNIFNYWKNEANSGKYC